MKNNFRKALSTLLAILIIITACPITALAATAINGSTAPYQYTLKTVNNETYAVLTKYTGVYTLTNITVPSKIDNYSVIGMENTFNGARGIENITVENGVKYIGGSTFANLTESNTKDKYNLSKYTETYFNITLPASVEYIGRYAFSKSNIKSINFSEGLLAIDNYAFSETCFSKKCKLTFPDSLTYLCEKAFASGGNLRAVHFGKNTDFYYQISYDCVGGVIGSINSYYKEFTNPLNNFPMLTEIEVSEGSKYLTAVDNILYTADMKTLISCHGSGLNSSGEYIYFDVVIPDGVEKILGYAFWRKMVTNVTLSSSVKEICAKAFYASEISSLNFGNNCRLEYIGDYAFKSCEELTGELIIPKSVTEIGNYAFSNTQLTDISFETPALCNKIGIEAFSSNSCLKSVFIPNSVEMMGDRIHYEQGYNVDSAVFVNCTNLETITFEENSKLKYWGKNTFKGCSSLKAIWIGENSALEEIYDDFSKTALETLDLSSCHNFKVLEGNFSGNRNLKAVNLSNTQLSRIDKYAFNNCSSLETVILSEATGIIDSYAFANCTSLAEINLENIKAINENAFSNCPKLEGIIPEKTAKEYNGFIYGITDTEATIIEYIGNDSNVIIPDTIDGLPVTEIFDRAFWFNKNLKTVTLSENLKSIGESAFEGCSALTEIPEFPKTLKKIGASAFSSCTSAKGEAVIPNGICSIPADCFYKCPITELQLSENLKEIGEYAFYGNELTELTLPDALESIGAFCFSEFIQKIHIGAALKDLTNLELEYNKALIEITVSPESNTFSAEDGILYNKDKSELIIYPCLKEDESIMIKDSVTAISDYAFSGAYNLKQVSFGKGIEKIGAEAFADCCSIEYIYLPNTIKEVGYSAFYNCKNLKKAEFGEGFTVPELRNVFYMCKGLETVIIPDSARIEIFDSAFRECPLSEINIPCGTKIIGNSTFTGAKFETIHLPETVTEIWAYAFENSSLAHITIPASVKKITGGTFENCKNLVYVNLSNITHIMNDAFANCTALESIDLTGVTYTAPDAFKGCGNLKKFYFTKEEKEAYIAENEFKGNETIETIVVGNSITSIEENAFANCTSLETALIADSVTSIADTAFDNCESLTIVCLEDSYAETYAARKNIPYTTFMAEPIADQLYTGKEITPKVNVSAKNESLTENTDYSVVYTNNIHIGTANANIIGLGDYSIFACLMKFNIIPNPDIKDDTEDEKNSGNTQNGTSNPSAGTDNKADNKNNNLQNNIAASSAGGNHALNRSSDSGSAASGSRNNSTDKAISAGSTASESNADADVAGTESTDNLQNGSSNTDANTAEAENSDKARESGSAEDDEKKLSLWEKFINMLLSFFEKIVSFFKNLFS